jgi:hypothetical protein
MLVLINTIVLAGLLLATEVALRLYYPGYGFYSRTQPGQYEDQTFGGRRWPRKDHDLGWVLRGGTPEIYIPKGRKMPVYTANPQGFRDNKDFATIDWHSGKTRVMMLGDSFLFGVHLDAQDTIPAILARKFSTYEVYNLGIPGWGVDQMYLAYKKYADVIKPQIVVLLYVDDDLKRIYEAFRMPENMNKPSFSLQGNRLVPRKEPEPESFWQRQLIAKSILANHFYRVYKVTEIRKLAKALFAELIAATHRRGERFMVVRLPVFADLPKRTWPDVWSLKGFFAEKDCLYMNLGEHMPRDEKFYLPNDAHFSAQGTAYVTELISKTGVFNGH